MFGKIPTISVLGFFAVQAGSRRDVLSTVVVHACMHFRTDAGGNFFCTQNRSKLILLVFVMFSALFPFFFVFILLSMFKTTNTQLRTLYYSFLMLLAQNAQKIPKFPLFNFFQIVVLIKSTFIPVSSFSQYRPTKTWKFGPKSYYFRN